MTHTTISLLRHWARQQASVTALSIAGREIGYLELYELIERAAAVFEARGVTSGDRICICADNALSYWAAVFAITRLGAIAAPLHSSFTRSELDDRIRDYAPRLIIVDHKHREKFAACTIDQFELESLERACAKSEMTRAPPPHPDLAAFIIMTSGSTARPKGVVLTHRSTVNYSTFWALQESGYRRGARIMGAGVVSTAAGFVKVPQFLLAGATFVFETNFDSDKFLKTIVGTGVTTFGGVPYFYEQMARSEHFADADFSKLELATFSGGVMSDVTKKAWAEKGVFIRQGYGQTECGGIITLAPPDLARIAPEKCGSGSSVAEIRVTREDGDRCPPGEAGEIEVLSVAAMREYWNDRDATQAAMRGDWIRTGDVGALDEAGDLTFVARLKDIIVSGGLKIAAAELEAVIAGIDGVEEVAVIGVPDATYGETPLAMVFTRTPLAPDEVTRRCREVLAGYKLPRYLVQTEAPLPRLPMGKLDKAALRRVYADSNKLPKPMR